MEQLQLLVFRGIVNAQTVSKQATPSFIQETLPGQSGHQVTRLAGMNQTAYTDEGNLVGISGDGSIIVTGGPNIGEAWISERLGAKKAYRQSGDKRLCRNRATSGFGIATKISRDGSTIVITSVASTYFAVIYVKSHGSWSVQQIIILVYSKISRQQV